MTDLHDLLDGHDFSEALAELEEDDIVMDVVMLVRMSKPQDFGTGNATLLVAPEAGMDPIVLTGMLHQALRNDDLDD